MRGAYRRIKKLEDTYKGYQWHIHKRFVDIFPQAIRSQTRSNSIAPNKTPLIILIRVRRGPTSFDEDRAAL